MAALAARQNLPKSPVAEAPQETEGASFYRWDHREGRAVNDPRVEARPVGVVEIVTTHPVLFSDVVAPPVAPSEHSRQRASNDPRGPRNSSPRRSCRPVLILKRTQEALSLLCPIS